MNFHPASMQSLLFSSVLGSLGLQACSGAGARRGDFATKVAAVASQGGAKNEFCLD